MLDDYILSQLDKLETERESLTMQLHKLVREEEEENQKIQELLEQENVGIELFSPRAAQNSVKAQIELIRKHIDDLQYEEAKVQGEEVFCWGLRDHFGILCDGTIVPCCLDREGFISLGNIFTDDLTEVLQSPRAKAIVEGFSQRKAPEQLCRKCGYARRFG